VPALVTDLDILTETPAILAFIAQTYPRAALAPLDDPFAFAQVHTFNNLFTVAEWLEGDGVDLSRLPKVSVTEIGCRIDSPSVRQLRKSADRSSLSWAARGLAASSRKFLFVGGATI
jgi:glutathione S-transferase